MIPQAERAMDKALRLKEGSRLFSVTQTHRCEMEQAGTSLQTPVWAPVWAPVLRFPLIRSQAL